jgi:hypothetical protein
VSHAARVEVPGVFHLVEQRVRRDLRTHMETADRHLSLAVLGSSLDIYGIQLCGYNILSDWVLVVLIPAHVPTISLALQFADRTFVRLFNQLHHRVSPLWQHPYHCCPFSNEVSRSVLRYVDKASMRADDVRPGDGRELNSAGEHAGLLACGLLTAQSDRMPPTGPWHAWLESHEDERFVLALEQCLRTGKPFGAFQFVRKVELACGRRTRPACLKWPGLFHSLP